MKNYYVIKNEEQSVILEKYFEAEALLKTIHNGQMKGFYNKVDASKWANKPNAKKIFVVLVGRQPGIYSSFSEMIVQVKNFDGAVVKASKSLEGAKKIFEKRQEILAKEKRVKLPKEEKEKFSKERLKNLHLNYNGDVLCFVDCEANKNKAISIGAVIYNKATKQLIDTYYSLLKPLSFYKLDYYVANLTGLTDQEILNARSADVVKQEFVSFLMDNNVTDIFSWGKNDKIYLSSDEQNNLKLFKSIINIQPFISAVTVNDCYNPNWSLKNMMYMFNIDSTITHNALFDAMDLCNVYQCWINKKLSKERMNELIKRR